MWCAPSGPRSRWPAKYRVGLQQRVERNRHRIDIDWTGQLHCGTEEGLTLREHFLAARQLSNHGCWKHHRMLAFR